MPCFHPGLDKRNVGLKCKRCRSSLPFEGKVAVCYESGFTLPCVSKCNRTHQKEKQVESD